MDLPLLNVLRGRSVLVFLSVSIFRVLLVLVLVGNGAEANSADEEAHEAESEEGVESVSVDSIGFLEGECTDEEDCSYDDGSDSIIVAGSGLVTGSGLVQAASNSLSKNSRVASKFLLLSRKITTARGSRSSL